MDELLSYARKYFEVWRVTPVPITYDVSDKMEPVIRWGDLYEKDAVIIKDERVWKKASGIAILPRGNHVVIDLDLPHYMSRDRYATVFSEMFVVVLSRRGLHLHFEADRPVGQLEVVYYGEKIGEGGGSLFKHLWTVPPTRRGDFQYRFYKHDDVPDLPKYSWDEAKNIIEAELQAVIKEVAYRSLSGNDSIYLDAGGGVEGINDLSSEQLKILLFLIFHDVGCYGLRDLVYEWLKTEQVGMRKIQVDRRTSRFYFLHTVAAVLGLLGASEAKAAEVINTYEDLDGKPQDSHENSLYTIFRWEADLFRKLYVMKRGNCIFCLIKGYDNCQKNPVMRVYYYLQSRGRERVRELVKKLRNS